MHIIISVLRLCCKGAHRDSNKIYRLLMASSILPFSLQGQRVHALLQTKIITYLLELATCICVYGFSAQYNLLGNA